MVDHRRADARRNYARILAVAEQEVAAHGGGASLEQIARIAGVGSATVRRHFPTRHALLEAVSRERVEALRLRAHDLVGKGDSRAALLEWLDEVVDYCVTARGLAAALAHPADDLLSGNSCAVTLEQAAEHLLRRAAQDGRVAPGVTVADLITLIVGIVLATEHHADPAGETHRLFRLAVQGLSPDRLPDRQGTLPEGWRRAQSGGIDHDVTDPAPASGEQFWDEFYAAEERIWSGNANPLLVQEVEALPPGAALDLGCGEGGDAIWLARNGWRVTAVDIAAEALRRGADHARDAGVADAVHWERHDLSRSFPDGEFDLVSAQFLHSPVAQAGERETILRRAAAAVAAGGILLVAGHAGWPSWVSEPPHDVHFPTTGEVLAALDLEPGRWRVEREELIEREATDPEGRPGRRADNILRLRRAAS